VLLFVGIEKENAPDTSLTVPVEVPLTNTEAPISGSFLSSVIVPEMVR
jgi:hypothetical protein